jgi:hypothetical protein
MAKSKLNPLDPAWVWLSVRAEGDFLLMFGNKIAIKLATASPNPAITQSAACQENAISSSEVTPGSAAFPRSPAKL